MQIIYRRNLSPMFAISKGMAYTFKLDYKQIWYSIESFFYDAYCRIETVIMANYAESVTFYAHSI